MSGPRPVALEPLILRLGELLRQCGVLHGDETPVEQVDPGRGKTNARICGPGAAMLSAATRRSSTLDEQPGRGGKYAVEFLAGWEGTLMDWLFAGSEAAGQRAAALQSLRETARLNGIEPMAWLTDTLEKLPTWPGSGLDELLPLRKVPAA